LSFYFIYVIVKGGKTEYQKLCFIMHEVRGGGFNDYIGTGGFAFYYVEGESGSRCSFRLVL